MPSHPGAARGSLRGHRAGAAGVHFVAPCTADSSSLMEVTSVLVVSSRPPMLAAFCNAVRTTYVGSMMPAWNMSTQVLVTALKPSFFLRDDASSTTTEGSSPAFSAIWRIGASQARFTISTP